MDFYTYKILKSSWGIRIGFEWEAIVEDTPHLIKIADNLSIDLNAVFLTKRQQWYVLKAFEYIRTKIEQPISIRLKQLIYNFTDFQEEGLYCGIVSWAAQTYSFDTPHFDPIFDKKQNGYYFLNIPQYGFTSETMQIRTVVRIGFKNGTTQIRTVVRIGFKNGTMQIHGAHFETDTHDRVYLHGLMMNDEFYN